MRSSVWWSLCFSLSPSLRCSPRPSLRTSTRCARPAAEADAIREEATTLARFFLPQIPFYGLTALGVALLNARRRFAAPAFAPVLNNLIVIAALVLLPHVVDGDIDLDSAIGNTTITLLLGLGTTLGIVAMTAAVWIAVRHAGIHIRARMEWRHPAVREVARLSGWTVGYVIANQIALLVVSILALREEGHLSAYQAAFIFFQLPHGLLAVSLMTTFAPDLAERAGRGDIDGYRDRMSLGLRLLALVMAPAAIGYAVLAVPLVSALIERGALSADDAILTAHTVGWFAAGLLGFSIYLFVLRGFYALEGHEASVLDQPRGERPEHRVGDRVRRALGSAGPRRLLRGRLQRGGGGGVTSCSRARSVASTGGRSRSAWRGQWSSPSGWDCSSGAPLRSWGRTTVVGRSRGCWSVCSSASWPTSARCSCSACRKRSLSAAFGGADRLPRMIKYLKRQWAYWTAKLTGSFNERADPKVQLEQAMQEAQEQHRRLREQAANVIANQKQTELRLNRALEELTRVNGNARQALVMASDAQKKGDEAKSTEYNAAAEAFANRLIALERDVEDLKTLSLQSAQAADQAKAAVQQNATALQRKLSERQKLLSQLDQAKMQEQMNKAMASLSATVGDDTPTFDEVRDKIEARYAKAKGMSELTETSVESRMLEIEQAAANSEANVRLDEMRVQLGLAAAPEPAAVEAPASAPAADPTAT